MTDQLLDLEQACARLATSPATFRRWLRHYRVQPAVVGRGPGGKNRYRAADIDRLATQVGNHEQPLSEHERPVIDQLGTHDLAVIDLEQSVSGQAIALVAIAALVKRAEASDRRVEAADQRADAERARADALAVELRRERDARLAAEWEAARWRPLTPIPDPPPAPRRRWWWRAARPR